MRPMSTAAPAARTRIKICGITHWEDARAAVDAGADALGFVFWPGSGRYIAPAAAAEIVRRAPAFVQTVGLFVQAAPLEVARAVQASGVQMIQCHGGESAAQCELAAAAANRPWMRAFGVGQGGGGDKAEGSSADALLNSVQPFRGASAWLFDTASAGHGGSGTSFDWQILHQCAARLSDHPDSAPPLVLSGGLSAQNVAGAIELLRPTGRLFAVDVSSGVEALDADGKPRKGLKDPARIRAFIDEVLKADARVPGQS
jgi:phosphoribosylanthranilate isomerase